MIRDIYFIEFGAIFPISYGKCMFTFCQYIIIKFNPFPPAGYQSVVHLECSTIHFYPERIVIIGWAI